MLRAYLGGELGEMAPVTHYFAQLSRKYMRRYSHRSREVSHPDGAISSKTLIIGGAKMRA